MGETLVSVMGSLMGQNNLRNAESNVPACLTVIGTLSRSLEKEPLVLEVLFRGSGVGDDVRLVVFGDEIGDYGTRFPEDGAGVGVFDS